MTLDVYTKRITAKFVKVGGVEIKLSDLVTILSALSKTKYGETDISIPEPIAQVLSAHGMIIRTLRGTYSRASNYEKVLREWFPDEAESILV
jgi:hypothetical protein